MAFLPPDFEVPELLETDRFRIRPLTIHDVVKDYDAVMTSREYLWDQFGQAWGWPSEDLTLEQDLIDLASNDGIIEKSGSWFAFKGERIGQGRENAKDYLRDHPEVRVEVERQVMEKYGIGKPALAAVPAPAEEAPAEGHAEKRQRVKAAK